MRGIFIYRYSSNRATNSPYIHALQGYSVHWEICHLKTNKKSQHSKKAMASLSGDRYKIGISFHAGYTIQDKL